MTAKTPSQPRKSLKQSLKNVFFGKSKKAIHQPPQQPHTIGSGILRQADPSAALLHAPSSHSVFPDFSDSQFSLHEYTTSTAIPNRFQTPPRCTNTRASNRQSLLPARSLSQFNLSHDFFQQSTVPSRQPHQVMSPTFTSIVSREASIASMTSMTSLSNLSTFSSVSTLRVQDSRRSLLSSQSSGVFQPAGARTFPRTGQLRNNSGRPKLEQKHVSWLQSPSNSTINHTDIGSVIDHGEGPFDSFDGPLVEHFKSFCILDTNTPGCPVVATSQELRYIFNIGEHFFLNSSECEGASMDIVTGRDAAGDPITHLVLFTPLVIPSSGRSRFMLASLIDVTRFIHDAASLPELEKNSNASSVESDLRTPLHGPLPNAWNEPTYKLSSEDLLGGCVLPQDREPFNRPSNDYREDIWLNLAKEERSRAPTAKDTPQSTHRTLRHPGSSDGSHSSGVSSHVDEVLDDFMGGLQELYSDFFLLGKSPLDETYYEICNVSPMLFDAKDYIHGHLSHTGPEGIARLSAQLAQASPFDLQVKWGERGQSKRLYCSPLYGQNSITWICFLVDHQIPVLW